MHTYTHVHTCSYSWNTNSHQTWQQNKSVDYCCGMQQLLEDLANDSRRNIKNDNKHWKGRNKIIPIRRKHHWFPGNPVRMMAVPKAWSLPQVTLAKGMPTNTALWVSAMGRAVPPPTHTQQVLALSASEHNLLRTQVIAGLVVKMRPPQQVSIHRTSVCP